MDAHSVVAPSVARVPLHTATEINSAIREAMYERLDYYRAHPDEVGQRLNELNEEWDVERALAAGSSCLTLLGLTLGLRVRPRWLLLAVGVQSFYLQHTLQGWCPPLPILRRLGFRTPMEIELERSELKDLREDEKAQSPARPATL
jgi:hypothetical protein